MTPAVGLYFFCTQQDYICVQYIFYFSKCVNMLSTTRVVSNTSLVKNIANTNINIVLHKSIDNTTINTFQALLFWTHSAIMNGFRTGLSRLCLGPPRFVGMVINFNNCFCMSLIFHPKFSIPLRDSVSVEQQQSGLIFFARYA